LQEAAELCLRKSHYAADLVTELDRYQLAFDQPFFKEFVIRDCDGEIPTLLKEACDAGLLAGVPLGKWYPDLDDCLLIAVTEKRTRTEIEKLAGVLAGTHSSSSLEGTACHA
jgi:glycine dehydrogenase subunit 1